MLSHIKATYYNLVTPLKCSFPFFLSFQNLQLEPTKRNHIPLNAIVYNYLYLPITKLTKKIFPAFAHVHINKYKKLLSFHHHPFIRLPFVASFDSASLSMALTPYLFANIWAQKLKISLISCSAFFRQRETPTCLQHAWFFSLLIASSSTF